MHLFIPAIWITAGVSLFSGVLFTLAGLPRQREPAFVPFGLLCLLLSVYLILTAEIYLLNSAATAGQVERYRIMLLCLIYPLAVWFFGEFTNLHKLKFWLIAFALVFGTFLIVNMFSIGNLLYSGFTLDNPIVLPWGETLSNVNGKSGPLVGLFYAASYAFFL
ncbi:MAG TPA: hypothetical protein VNF46_03640, partial [Gammaproteobacteria bacterium]|nr:hypothetical protein [Gammaproteobacteria bacterium]